MKNALASREWTKQNATYDALIAIGDCTPAQQARLSIALWSMVQCDLGDYLPADIAVYERNARKGQSYLAKHNLPTFPDSREIAEINLIY